MAHAMNCCRKTDRYRIATLAAIDAFIPPDQDGEVGNTPLNQTG
jgi:hypothetical protein